ncbi:MAG: division plane positioning ATPase MipZ, partial [Pseudomonadota bacterium]
MAKRGGIGIGGKARRERPNVLLFLRANLARAGAFSLVGLATALLVLLIQKDSRYTAEILLHVEEHAAIGSLGADALTLLDTGAAGKLALTVRAADVRTALQNAQSTAEGLMARAAEATLARNAAELSELRAAIAEVKGDLAAEPAAAAELKLKRLAQEERALEASMVGQPQPLSVLATQVAPSNALVWHPAPFVLGSALLAGLLGLILAALPHLRRQRILTLSHVERASQHPAIGLLPEARPRRRSPLSTVMYSPASHLADALRALRAQLVPRGPSEGRVLMLTSSTRGEGVSTTSLLLAQTLAGWGKRVLLIDADTRKRTLTRMIDAPDQPGLLSLLAGLSSLQDVEVEPDGLSISVLPVEDASAHAADILASDRFREF